MRIILLAALVALSPLLPAPAFAGDECPTVVQAYGALFGRGLRLEASAAAMPPGAGSVRRYREAAQVFEMALCARDQQGVTDHRIYNALGTVYLGAGDLVQADSHLRRGLAVANSMTRTERGRFFATVGYLYALRGDNASARRYYGLAIQSGNPSAAQSLATLQRRQTR